MKSFSKIKGNNIPVKNKEKPPSVSYIHSTPRGNKTAVSLFISGTEKKETGNYEIDRKYPKPFSLLFLFSAGMKIRPQGRSSDLFRIRCLPGTIPVAKSIGTHISPEAGTIPHIYRDDSDDYSPEKELTAAGTVADFHGIPF